MSALMRDRRRAIPGGGGGSPVPDRPLPQHLQSGGNALAAADLGGPELAEASGPFGDVLNAALSECFGSSLDGLSASFGDSAANEAIAADAHTRGRSMSFGGDVREDPSDGFSMEVLGEEVAHALAGGGSGRFPLDQEGDRGEAAAHDAGHAFRRWAESGFEGPAPSLSPAHGGEAAVHRHPTGGASLTGSPLLRNGSSGSEVIALQELLNDNGASLVVDGIFGPKTESAVVAYQQSHGLMVDGIVGPETAGSLTSSGGGESTTEPAPAPAPASGGQVTGDPLLKVGSSGALVEELQRQLNTFDAGLTVDGDFGAKTDGAVRGFQSANGLTVDGVVGPQTAGKLYDPSASDVAEVSSGSSFAGVSAYDDLREAVLAAAASHLGAPYYWGADGPDMFDCSGFVLYVLRNDTGIVSWGDDTAAGIKNRVPATNDPQKGDLVFYSSGGSVQHVEMVTGSGSQEIGASGGGSSTFGNDPGAKVQYGDMNADSRSRSYGSIESLLASAKV